MKNNKLLKIIMIMIFLIILLLIGILVIISSQKNVIIESDGDYIEPVEENVTKKISNYSTYQIITSSADAYLTTVYKNHSVYIEAEEMRKEDLYNLLSKKYINENGITTQNIYNYIQLREENTFFVPIDIRLNETYDQGKYVIYGILEDQTTYEKLEEVYLIVNLDYTNLTFSIEPLDNNYKSIDEVDLSGEKEVIEENEINTYKYTNVSTETILKEYLDIYKKMALGSPDILYNYIDNNYKNAKFNNSLTKLKEYITEQQDELKVARLEKYQVKQYDDYTQYILVDQNNNYYVVNEEAPLQYTLLFDLYTIPLPEFLEEYNSSNIQNKVALQVDRIQEAINNQDYEFLYSKLADSFKARNFTTQQAFENYMKANFFENNEFTYISFENQEDNYMYTITVKDASAPNGESVEKTFVVNLKENADFVYSFSL